MRLLIIIAWFIMISVAASVVFNLEDYAYEKLYFDNKSKEEQILILKKLDYTDEEILEFFKHREQGNDSGSSRDCSSVRSCSVSG